MYIYFRLIAEITCLLIAKYGKYDNSVSTIDSFFKALDQRQMWNWIFAAEGPYKELVEKHPYFVGNLQCIIEIAEKLKRLEIGFKFIKHINERKRDVRDIMSRFFKEEEVDKWILCNQQKSAEEWEKLRVVETVTSAVKVQDVNLPESFHEFCQEIEKREELFNKGEINGKNCDMLWKGITHIPDYCRDLETVIQSVVFWNLVRDELTNSSNENRKTELAETDSFEHEADSTVRQNSDDLDIEQMDAEGGFRHCTSSVEYIKKMRFDCMEKYEINMTSLLKTNDISMLQIIHLFDWKSFRSSGGGFGPNLDMEREISEKAFPSLTGSFAWETLKRIYSIGQIKTKVENICSFLSSFKIDLNTDNDFSAALKSFEHLLLGKVNEYSFMQVKTELDLMYSVINMLSDHSFDIIEAIGKCSSLVDFLKETVDEDIRNLIDAVEDISEQQVRESTVSGLIEIKQMLLPLLKGESGESCKEILCQVEQQITKTSKTTSIPVKIHECMDNLHNLKFLYHNVANRGEQTKQIVKNICEHGVFRFFLDERPGCVLVEARYEQNESIVRKNISELTDLRSRSLLLMNKESSIDNLSREQVENFVEYIDLSIDVADLYTLLHTSGHFKYMAINNEELLPGDLALTRRKLDEELEEWQTELSEERKKHYFMNFIHGFRLHSMFQYLNMNDDVANEDKENLEDTVNSILVFVHQNMKARELRKHYLEKREKCKFWTNKEWLNCLGTALHAAYSSSFTDLEKDILCKDKNDTLKITDVVEEGKLFVSQLDERSPYTVRTVLALYANTVNRMPMPHQVLFCTPETTLDEIELLIERCLGAKSFYGCKSLYCIANVELLPSELHFDLLDMLRDLQERHRQFLLALVCRGTNSNPIINELSEFTTTLAPATENFVRSVFTEQYGDIITFTSEVAGLGKSCKIFKDAQRKQKAVKILHVSGCARKGHIIERLRSLKVRSYHVLHIDIGTVDNPKSLDTLLFELLILGYASAGRECVALKTNYVYIEIANTINETLKNSLPTTMLFSREHIQWQKFNDFVVSKEVNSSVQMSCKYFDYLEKGYLDRRDLNMNEKNPLSTKKCRRLLKTFLNTEDDMSFPVVNATLDVLADQFKKMSCSPFFKISRLRDMIGNRKEQTVKSSLVKEIIKSAKEFASRSVGSCRATQTSTILPDAENLSNDLSKPSDTAESVTERIKGMIRWEDSNHLMFVFHCQNIQTLSPLYRDRNKVPDNIKTLFQSQMNKQLQDFRSFNQAQLQDFIQKIARDNPLPLDGKTLSQMASEYALTPDNLLKMVLIMLRVKANVPVVIMGETGCGKTSLVRYLASICEVQFDVMNIHAGVSEREIIDKVYKNCRLSYDKLNLERWLFLDEINTSESIGVMNEIICHRKCLGVSLPPNLIVMGACNPYKLRSKKSIETAGLTLKSKHDELSRLVYRVLPLPEIMVDYVWDFGSLNENDEKCYIYRMVDGLFDDEKLQSLFSELLSVSQVFVRQKEASEYVVSLRDVYRCKLLTRWFMEVLKRKLL